MSLLDQPVSRVRDRNGTITLSTTRGSWQIDVRASGVVVTAFAGDIDMVLVAPIVRELDAIIGKDDAVELFVDASQMRTYDSALRVQLTDWVRDHAGVQVHVLSMSKIVSMAMTVSALALKRDIKGYFVPVRFEAAVRTARPRR